MNKNVLRKKRMGTSNLLQGVEHEIRVMKLLDHPNIIKLYEVQFTARAYVASISNRAQTDILAGHRQSRLPQAFPAPGIHGRGRLHEHR
jgi:hypothetical protein